MRDKTAKETQEIVSNILGQLGGVNVQELAAILASIMANLRESFIETVGKKEADEIMKGIINFIQTKGLSDELRDLSKSKIN